MPPLNDTELMIYLIPACYFALTIFKPFGFIRHPGIGLACLLVTLIFWLMYLNGSSLALRFGLPRNFFQVFGPGYLLAYAMLYLAATLVKPFGLIQRRNQALYTFAAMFAISQILTLGNIQRERNGNPSPRERNFRGDPGLTPPPPPTPRAKSTLPEVVPYQPRMETMHTK